MTVGELIAQLQQFDSTLEVNALWDGRLWDVRQVVVSDGLARMTWAISRLHRPKQITEPHDMQRALLDPAISSELVKFNGERLTRGYGCPESVTTKPKLNP